MLKVQNTLGAPIKSHLTLSSSNTPNFDSYVDMMETIFEMGEVNPDALDFHSKVKRSTILDNML